MTEQILSELVQASKSHRTQIVELENNFDDFSERLGELEKRIGRAKLVPSTSPTQDDMRETLGAQTTEVPSPAAMRAAEIICIPKGNGETYYTVQDVAAIIDEQTELKELVLRLKLARNCLSLRADYWKSSLPMINRTLAKHEEPTP